MSAYLDSLPRTLHELDAELSAQIEEMRRIVEQAQARINDLTEGLRELTERREAVGEEISLRAMKGLRWPPNP